MDLEKNDTLIKESEELYPPGPFNQPVEEKKALDESLKGIGNDDQILGLSNQAGPAREAPQSVKTFSQVCELIARAPKESHSTKSIPTRQIRGQSLQEAWHFAPNVKLHNYIFTVTKTTHVAKVVKIRVEDPVKKTVCTVCTFLTEAGETVHTHCAKYNAKLSLKKKEKGDK